MTHPISEKKLDVGALLSMLGDMSPMHDDPQRRYKTEWAREELAQIAPKIAAEHIALTKKVDELEAAVSAEWERIRSRLNSLHREGAITYGEMKHGLNSAGLMRDAALNDTTQCRESDNG